MCARDVCVHSYVCVCLREIELCVCDRKICVCVCERDQCVCVRTGVRACVCDDDIFVPNRH